ncbi:SHOCT domain-containing protein [Streptomonospora sp. S1-112]|uniref:SHOCT domain-containing protein n=1 Tax=Streptomonospora mangrovi TaxID=2883123 RepID=A0A9X3SDP2_9ACTN|nr:SHOCT domain-containing protein [Streptomonospora mangrovi]MDA0562875.1 SHOCT domain-containing protein [Streptomonospora mangrovi]
MNTTALLVAGAGFGGPAFRDHPGPPPFHPMIGVSMLLLLLALGVIAYLLVSRAKGGPPWAHHARRAHHQPPEAAARQVLAERFARGDISVEEFLERASVLNWTPGAGEGKRR